MMKRFTTGLFCFLCCLTPTLFAITNFYSDNTISSGNSFSNVFVWNDASISMNGGQVNYLDLLNSSRFEIEDGTLAGQISVWNQSELTVQDGQINGSLQCADNGVINLYGGSFSDWIYAEDSSVVNVYGYDFVYDPLAGSGNGGQLTGRWAYGDTFAIDFIDNIELDSTFYDHVVLHEFVPEPCTLVLLSMGFSALQLRRKR